MAAGEAEALRLPEPFATAWASVPTTSRFLGARPIRLMCAWLAVNGSPADVALAFVANLQTWGRSWRTKWKRMRKVLATRVTGLSFGVLVATPALADVSTTQTLPGAGPATPGR
jgi:hypothetical protein